MFARGCFVTVALEVADADRLRRPRSRTENVSFDRLSILLFPIRRSITPTKINRGGAIGERHVGQARQKCRAGRRRE